MRQIKISQITEAVASLAQEINYCLDDATINILKKSQRKEKSKLGKEALRQIVENIKIASQERIPLCQDTGTSIIFLEIGEKTRIIGGSLEKAINEGIKKGYRQGYLRNSIVDDVLFTRKNTESNTPAIIHTQIVPGDKIALSLMAKGAGSENMSRLAMLKPSEGIEGVKKFALKTIQEAGANPCPPIVVGIGIGGSMEKAAILAKKALLRKTREPNKDKKISALEKDLLKEINHLGLGPQGLGGEITGMAVHIETYPTHLGSLPVAVNINCWAARHGQIVI